MLKFLKLIFSGALIRGYLVIALLFGLLIEFPVFGALDGVLLERLVRLHPATDSKRVVVVGIDKPSIDKVGSWPWPRTYLAELISTLSEQSPAAVGFHLLLPDREWNPALSGLQSLRRKLKLDSEQTLVGKSLVNMERSVDGDKQLRTAVDSLGRVVLPYRFVSGTEAMPDDEFAPERFDATTTAGWQEQLTTLRNPLRNMCRHENVGGLQTSFAGLRDSGKKEGLLDYDIALRGRIRQANLLTRYAGKLYPSIALQLSRMATPGEVASVNFDPGSLILDGRPLAVGDDFRLYVNPLTVRAIQKYAFADVVNGLVPEGAFKDKIVVVGLTAATDAPGGKIELSEPAPVLATASLVSDILNRRQLYRPSWGFLVEVVAFLYLGMFFTLVMPRLRPLSGGLLLFLFFIGWFTIVGTLFALKGMWFQIAPHAVLIAIGFPVFLLQYYFSRSGQSFEDLKMLGLSFQSQGMLDMAFEKFRRCPLNDKSMKDLLYNLGLDFERKRMVNKAIEVYSHLLRGGNFKDVKAKIADLKKVEQTVILGGGGRRDETLVLRSGSTNPTLGRYEIVRVLGQGAMGSVYLGRDPKINREVAIKTLDLNSVDPEMLSEIKERFFREAEAAGRLTHPSIVTIFDVGEEHDLAYMAMEYLSGHDLSAHCSSGSLLPVCDVLRIVADVAEALAYAHTNKVVHRDIKPSNLILLEEGKVKVADFGIARVVDSSQTQTGTILGTPSYMSPEQVVGRKVTGSSDLFSLGVVFYELLTGEKPFVGESMGSLMHNIANVKYTPLKKVRPDLPECCYRIVRKMLKKELPARYENAEELAGALRKCLDEVC